MARSTEKLSSTITKSRIGRLVAPLALALGVVTPSAAHAWIYSSGAACTPKNSTEAAKLEYDHVLGMGNKSTSSSATLYCPFTHDDDNVAAYGEVWVTDQNPSSNVSCSIRGRNRYGTVVYYSGSKSTAGSSSAADSLLFTGLPVSEYRMAFTAMCSLPPSYNGAVSRITNFGMDFQD